MNCVDSIVTESIVQTKTTPELLHEMYKAVVVMDSECLTAMSYYSGVSLGQLYAFRTGRSPVPKVETINKMLKFLAPGYNVGAVPIPTVEPVAAE